jgi:hypothetical protein
VLGLGLVLAAGAVRAQQQRDPDEPWGADPFGGKGAPAPQPEPQPQPAPPQDPAAAPAPRPPATEPQVYDPDAPEIPAARAINARAHPPSRVSPTESVMVVPGEKVDANEVLDEMLDELAADVARLGAAQVTPLLLQRVRVSDNMHPDFAQVLEARMVASLQRAASVAVIKCVECFSTRGRVENATWIVSRGITDREELKQTAARYGAKMMLSAVLTLYTNPSSLALDVELIRAEDGAIFFAEAYRVHPHTAQLYRAADRAQKREARLKDLEERLNQRPQIHHGFFASAMLLPSDDAPEGPVVGGKATYRIMEAFGPEREYRVGLNLAAFTNPRRLPFVGMVGPTLQMKVLFDNIYLPQCHAGASAGYMVANPGDGWLGSPYFGGVGECVLSHRIALHAGLHFVIPFQYGTNFHYGGFTPEAGVAFIW